MSKKNEKTGEVEEDEDESDECESGQNQSAWFISFQTQCQEVDTQGQRIRSTTKGKREEIQVAPKVKARS